MNNTAKNHILVEYIDGTFQWIKNVCEKEVSKNKKVKRICSCSYGNIEVNTRRWKIGKSQFDLVLLD
jgi:hypothetical protein